MASMSRVARGSRLLGEEGEARGRPRKPWPAEHQVRACLPRPVLERVRALAVHTGLSAPRVAACLVLAGLRAVERAARDEDPAVVLAALARQL